MRTTVDLDADLIEEALKLTGLKQKTRLLEEALREIIRKSKREGIIKKFGKLSFNSKVLSFRHKR